MFKFSNVEKIGRDLIQSYSKGLIPKEMSKGQIDNTKTPNKKFDYTAIADRLRTVRWNNYSHPTGVVNRFTGPTSPLPATAMLSKEQKILNKTPYIDNKPTATPSG